VIGRVARHVYSDLLRYRLLLRRFPKARGPSRSHRTELLRRRVSGRENGVGAVRSGHWEGSRATGTIESLKKTKKVKYCAPFCNKQIIKRCNPQKIFEQKAARKGLSERARGLWQGD
jgi:hypothetical protein